MRRLEAMGFERFTPPIERTDRVLIVGAGPSATSDTLARVRAEFDAIITLNGAWSLVPQAEIHSYEFAFRSPEIVAEQRADVMGLPLARVLYKPYSLTQMPYRSITELVTQLQLRNPSASPRFIPHNNISGARLCEHSEYLMQLNRLPVQWRGSLTMWLDFCWLRAVRTIGLIGTDLGAWDSDGRFVSHPTNSTNDGVSGLIDVLEYLRQKNYLYGVEFRHFHGNKHLERVLSN